MDVLNKFTQKNLLLNKKRTIVTIIGLILSTALICAVAGMASSTQKTMVNMVKQQDGDYHVRFENVQKEDIKYIKDNVQVEEYSLSSGLGYAKLEGSQNVDKPYVYVVEYDSSTLLKSGLELDEGRMPENSDEIVISKHIIQNGLVSLKVGETITLDIGTRRLTSGEELTQNNPYNEEGEEIVSTTQKTYTIVGIIERPSYMIENYSAPGYTVISYMSGTADLQKFDINVKYKNVKNYESITNSIINTLENQGNDNVSVNYNSDLIRFEGGLSDNTLKVLYAIAGVVIAIIVVSSVFVIRNSFSISVSEKTKQYGMLASVGATKKQIKKTVLLEGFYIGIIAIPLGILCGIIAVVILLKIVNLLLGDMMQGYEFVYNIPIAPIGLSVIISAITIYLSCIIPAKRATKISPIEAIRGNNDIKIKAKKLKTSKLTKKLFGIGGVIASKNLKRNRKKYRTTVISLVVSISIFISLFSFLEYGKKLTGMYYSEINYNISIYLNEDENESKLNLYKELIQMYNIDDYRYSFDTAVAIDIEKYGGEAGKRLAQAHGTGNEYWIYLKMIDRQSFERYKKELGINDDSDSVAILYDSYIDYDRDTNVRRVKHIYNVQSGDTIEVTLLNDQTMNIKITKLADQKPAEYENIYTDGGFLFVSEDFIQEKDNQTFHISELMVNSSDANKLEQELIMLRKENSAYSGMTIANYAAEADEQNRIVILVSIFLYGFITVITLIGVTNIFNTITTNMILRSKEFANLKSVGMTSKEFNKMIRLESVLYGLKSLIIGIPIGLVGAYAIYKSFANSVDFGYMVPWTAIAISAIFVFVIVGITMKYSLRKINKQNIIETIRQDNI